MKLYINNTMFSIKGKPSLSDPVFFILFEAPPDDLGDTLILKDDDGFTLCEIKVSDYKYWTASDSSIIGTNYKNEDPQPIPEATDTEVLNTLLGVTE